MRICLVYDCLYPHTVGGAERWYRNLAERLAADGHEVTYLTLRQWPRGADPGVSGVRVRAVGPPLELYRSSGPRRIWPPLRFGAGVLAHLARHGRSYDVVHTASFPYFGLLAAGVLRRARGYRVVVDWHELWTREYWRDYLGRAGGWVGWQVQRRCARVPQHAICFSRLHERRLRELDVQGEVERLEGEYAGGTGAGGAPRVADPVVVFAGRQIPEKRTAAILPALAAARQTAPELRAELYGAGPELGRVRALIAQLGLAGAVSAPGFVEPARVHDALARALCLLLPSRREGYGLVVVEAAALGTPSIVVAGPDNAATELIAEGVNGFVAPSASARDLAEAILRVHDAGYSLRESTASWYAENAERLSLAGSIERVARVYAGGP